jgi:hypothetical protein
MIMVTKGGLSVDNLTLMRGGVEGLVATPPKLASTVGDIWVWVMILTLYGIGGWAWLEAIKCVVRK